MYEMFQVIFVHKDDHPYVKGIRSSSIPMGVLNALDKKGGVLVEFSIYDHSFSIMNCHLMSGANNGEKKTDQMGSIMKAICAGKVKFEPDAAADFSIILGDLNYRFKSTYQDYIHNVENAHADIEKLDELHEARMLKKRYFGYHEEPIKFDPTYKRDKLSNGIYV